MDIFEKAERYIFNTYRRYPVCIVKGKGCRVWDKDGKEYIDFIGGIAVCALGHSPDLVIKAIEEQAKLLIHVSNLFYTIPQTELAEFLVKNSFADKVFFCNSGAEAIEAAIKLARRWANIRYGGKKDTIISMYGSFHGRTIGAVSATGQKKVREGFEPLLKGFRFVQFGDISDLERAIDDRVFAVLLEPIQGEGGVICPPEGYLKEVRRLCDEKGILLILDEIQTGCGRTGKLFAYEHYGIEPDIMTVAKAMANGLPAGAMLAKEKLSEAFTYGTHASTFGGNPLVTCVSLKVLEKIKTLLDHCRSVGEYFKCGLKELKKRYGFIKDVRGKGLILGMELQISGDDVVMRCLKKGFLINCVQGNVLRFVPPLIIERKHIDSLLEALDDVFKKI